MTGGENVQAHRSNLKKSAYAVPVGSVNDVKRTIKKNIRFVTLLVTYYPKTFDRVMHELYPNKFIIELEVRSRVRKNWKGDRLMQRVVIA